MPTGTPAITVQSPSKPWWASRTLWFNAAIAALAAAEANFGLLQPLLPANTYAVLTAVLAIGNAVLRVVTATGLVWRAVGEAEQ